MSGDEAVEGLEGPTYRGHVAEARHHGSGERCHRSMHRDIASDAGEERLLLEGHLKLFAVEVSKLDGARRAAEAHVFGEGEEVLAGEDSQVHRRGSEGRRVDLHDAHARQWQRSRV